MSDPKSKSDRPARRRRIEPGSYPALAGPPGVMLPTATMSVGGLGWLGPIHRGLRPRWYGRFSLGLAGAVLIAIFFVPVMARPPAGQAQAPADFLMRWGLPYEHGYSGWLWVMALAPLIAGLIVLASACLSHRLRGPFAAAGGLAGLLLLLVPHVVLRADKVGADPEGRAAVLVATTLTLLLLLICLAALVAAHAVARRRPSPLTQRWAAVAAAATLFVSLFLAVLLLGKVRLSETFIAPELPGLHPPLPDADLLARSCLVLGAAAFGASAVMGLVRLVPAVAGGHHLNRSGQYCGRAGWLLVLMGYLFYFHSLRPAGDAAVDRLSGAGLFLHLVLPYLLSAAVLAEGLSISVLLADHKPGATEAEQPPPSAAEDATPPGP